MNTPLPQEPPDHDIDVRKSTNGEFYAVLYESGAPQGSGPLAPTRKEALKALRDVLVAEHASRLRYLDSKIATTAPLRVLGYDLDVKYEKNSLYSSCGTVSVKHTPAAASLREMWRVFVHVSEHLCVDSCGLTLEEAEAGVAGIIRKMQQDLAAVLRFTSGHEETKT